MTAKQTTADEDRAPHESDMPARAATDAKPRVMLSEKQVRAVVPVSRTTLYRMEKEGHFPKSTYVSANKHFWFEDEVIAWQKIVDRSRGRHMRRASA
jgi:prophage regulatory protein